MRTIVLFQRRLTINIGSIFYLRGVLLEYFKKTLFGACVLWGSYKTRKICLSKIEIEIMFIFICLLCNQILLS